MFNIFKKCIELAKEQERINKAVEKLEKNFYVNAKRFEERFRQIWTKGL